MELKDVEAFLRVVDSGTLSAASRKHSVPKATLSHHVQRLESEMSITLFERKGGRLLITNAGQAFVGHARNIVMACQRASDAVLHEKGAFVGTLRVGASSELGTNLLGPLVLPFAPDKPNLRLELFVVRPAELFAPDTNFDCILIAGEPSIEMAGRLAQKMLGRFHSVLVSTPRYATAAGAFQRPDDIPENDRIAHRSDAKITPWILENGRTQIVLEPGGKFAANDFWLIKLLLLKNQGVALLPDFFVHRELGSGVFRTILPKWTSPSQPLYALYPAHRFSNPNIRVLLDHVAANFRRIYRYPYAIIDD
jgi:DNA-binding transcriptional LysR family regulator